jgi:hypothetical protein
MCIPSKAFVTATADVYITSKVSVTTIMDVYITSKAFVTTTTDINQETSGGLKNLRFPLPPPTIFFLVRDALS